MRQLSKHITLNWDYFEYLLSRKYLPRFRNLIATVFVFGHLKMSSNQELDTCTTKMCNIYIYINKLHQCIDNLIFF